MNERATSKDKFFDILNSALPKYDPTKARKGAKGKRGSYNGKKTRRRKTEDTSG